MRHGILLHKGGGEQSGPFILTPATANSFKKTAGSIESWDVTTCPGSTVTIEAAVRLELLTAIPGQMSRGSAVIDVQTAATRLVIETPNNHVLDHCTRFAMSVDLGGKSAAFEVLSCEISVHHAGTKVSEHLL
jgi:hypothetical protein